MGKIGAGLLWLLIAAVCVAVLWLIVLAVSALLVSPDKEYEKNSPYYRFLLNSSTAVAVRLFGIRLHTEGLEKIPAEGRFLLVGNHRSNFDPILTWYVLKKYQLAFISKPENFRIPIFGRLIRKCCFLPIDRENPRNAISTVHKAAKLLKKDSVSVCVYPEGTRSKSGELLPFHNGVFKIAQKAQTPIVVLSVSGTEKIHKNYLRRKTDVYLRIVDVIPAQTVTESHTAALGERVRQALLQEIEGA